MIENLIRYVRTMFHTIKKLDVVKSLNYALTSLNDEVLVSLDDVIKEADIKVINNSVILKSIMHGSGLKAGNNKDLLIKIRAVVFSITRASKQLEDLVNKHLSDVITDKTATVKDVAILKLVTDINSLTVFIQDFLYLILIEGKNENTDLPKIKLVQIKESTGSFSSILNAYGKDFNQTIDAISKLPSNSMYIDDSKISMLEKLVSKFTTKVVVPNTNGFTGNPIYHFRMWRVDAEIAKYESLKEKRKLIELKLLELRIQENKEENSNLRKQIEYWENKLSTTEYEISKIQDDI